MNKRTRSVCPVNLSSTYEYPHLIVPVNECNLNTALGNGHPLYPPCSNFDIPAFRAGKTSSLVFILPTKTQQWWDQYTMSGAGAINVYKLPNPASTISTFNNIDAGELVGSVPNLTPGSVCTISSGPCTPRQKLGNRIDPLETLTCSIFKIVIGC
ncbi:hypothetical protein K432DRAFT_385067 [Lepidopterella palustris CBS 459.81]|uniref:Ubiquitin 3 binding protein But2 C-terminal domain-containing protein n=1 Tax=Lepidopterella palustris CBS 459.81 TaxID=1314670 RepID=A0A8E2E487_9PEZI|nr:hypothetical protein K432DRAFT_385067 [Lepidopterella palustris CBS 459.81]